MDIQPRGSIFLAILLKFLVIINIIYLPPAVNHSTQTFFVREVVFPFDKQHFNS